MAKKKSQVEYFERSRAISLRVGKKSDPLFCPPSSKKTKQKRKSQWSYHHWIFLKRRYTLLFHIPSRIYIKVIKFPKEEYSMWRLKMLASTAFPFYENGPLIQLKLRLSLVGETNTLSLLSFAWKLFFIEKIPHTLLKCEKKKINKKFLRLWTLRLVDDNIKTLIVTSIEGWG